jgi:allantoate deiminase
MHVETVMERCDVLAGDSEDPGRITRPFASDSMRRAQEHVAQWMREAGMVVRPDNIGNLRGRYEGAASSDATLILGSHLDTVRDAGKYDGPLGVMVAIAAVQHLHDERKRLPFAIEVLGFADEEGLRFGSTYLGSRAVAGGFEPADLDRADASGVSMREAVHAFGGDPDRIDDDKWRGGRLLGYCEVHLEQGPVLEARNLPVGVVSGIAGQDRYSLVFKGVAGHAGTVPMDQRHDALVAASLFIEAVEGYARWHEGLVATVGQLTVQPGAANVIPGEVNLSLDVRHATDAELVVASHSLLDVASVIAKHRNIGLTITKISEHKAVLCDPALVSLMSEAIAGSGITAVPLASGAGHDAVAMSYLTEVAMLFVRCKGGVSHNPAESVTTADVAVAIDVLGRFLELLSERASH